MKIFILIFALSIVASAGTFTANTCSRGDVNECINNTGGTCIGGGHTAVDGDIIVIPAGTCAWTSGIVVPTNIGITIQGNGTPNSDGSTTGASASCGTGTTLTLAGNFTAFSFSPQFGNSTSRLSCLVSSYTSGGVIWANVLGTCTSSGCPNLRMDNVTFSNWSGHSSAGISFGINAIGNMFGVVDHNTITGGGGNFLQLVELSHANYLGVGQYGDNVWHLSENYGSANFLYFENNAFSESGCCEDEGSSGPDQTFQGGGRVALRFNTFTNMDNLNQTMSWHGTESNGRPRSVRAWENYGNIWTVTSGTPAFMGARGGTGLTWGNTLSQTGSGGLSTLVNLDTYRAGASTGGWGPCDGTGSYDGTDGGNPYFSGTISTYNSGTLTVTISGSPGWTTNQWAPTGGNLGAPWSLHDVTQNNGWEIATNGSNTLVLNSNLSGVPGSWTPAATDTMTITRAPWCLDQAAGRGAGILYSGATATPASSALEALSPTYSWSTTFNVSPGFGIIFSDTARVIQNRDYYAESQGQAAQSNATTPFDGTTSLGIGHGTLARRPTTCTTGVGYFATDQGSWNSSGNGFGNGLFYECTSTNTWTLEYTPYSYPHPLENNSQTAPPTCDHASGAYGGSFSNTCSTSSTGTVILCWSTTTLPITNGAGTGCTTGTSMTNGGSTTISSTETFNIVAGTSTLSDSVETTYSYTINNASPGSIKSANTKSTANTIQK